MGRPFSQQDPLAPPTPVVPAAIAEALLPCANAAASIELELPNGNVPEPTTALTTPELDVCEDNASGLSAPDEPSPTAAAVTAVLLRQSTDDGLKGGAFADDIVD